MTAYALSMIIYTIAIIIQLVGVGYLIGRLSVQPKEKK